MGSFDQKVHGDIQLLTPRKDLMGGSETKELSDFIQEIVAKGEPKIVVDLGKVSFLNSTGLGALVAGHVSCKNHQGWLRLARSTKRISNLFLITKLAFVFETFETVEEALVGKHSPEATNGGDK
jgi:anti-sigma B factor antagonist